MTTVIKMSRQRTQYALCIDTGDYQVDLERWKIYRVVPDRGAARHHLIRVVDDSGEDYLYPERFFQPVVLPPTLRRLFRYSAQATAG